MKPLLSSLLELLLVWTTLVIVEGVAPNRESAISISFSDKCESPSVSNSLNVLYAFGPVTKTA